MKDVKLMKRMKKSGSFPLVAVLLDAHARGPA
jgi:hypothetical protein